MYDILTNCFKDCIIILWDFNLISVRDTCFYVKVIVSRVNEIQIDIYIEIVTVIVLWQYEVLCIIYFKVGHIK